MLYDKIKYTFLIYLKIHKKGQKMPELPEVETVCLALSRIVHNSKIEDIDVLRSDLRWKIKKSLKH